MTFAWPVQRYDAGTFEAPKRFTGPLGSAGRLGLDLDENGTAEATGRDPGCDDIPALLLCLVAVAL